MKNTNFPPKMLKVIFTVFFLCAISAMSRSVHIVRGRNLGVGSRVLVGELAPLGTSILEKEEGDSPSFRTRKKRQGDVYNLSCLRGGGRRLKKKGRSRGGSGRFGRVRSMRGARRGRGKGRFHKEKGLLVKRRQATGKGNDDEGDAGPVSSRASMVLSKLSLGILVNSALRGGETVSLHAEGGNRSLRQFRDLRGGGGSDTIQEGGGLLPSISSVFSSSMRLAWIALVSAVVTDIGATLLMKIGTTKSSLSNMSSAVLLYNVSLLCFAMSLYRINVSTAFAVWSALGTAIISLTGITVFGERCTALKLLSLVSIGLGVVGLNFADDSP